MDKWVNLVAGTPLESDFGTTSGAGTPLDIDGSSGQLYYFDRTVKPLNYAAVINPENFGVKASNPAAANFAYWMQMDAYIKTLSPSLGFDKSLVGIRFPRIAEYDFGANTIDLMDGTFSIEGAGAPTSNTGTTLKFSGATGIRVQRYNTSGGTGTRAPGLGADGSQIRNLRLKGGYVATEGEFHGIDFRANGIAENVFTVNFEGDGIHSDASLGGAPEGSSSNTIIRNVGSVFNRRGLYINGADANVWEVNHLNAVANRTWGVEDSGFLGNAYKSCHAAANGWDGAIGSSPTGTTFGGNRYYVKVGQAVWCKANAPTGAATDNLGWGYIGPGGVYNGVPAWVINTYDFREGGAYKTDDPSARHKFDDCYSEGDQNPSQMVAPTIIFGGLHGAGYKGTMIPIMPSVYKAIILNKLVIAVDPDSAFEMIARDNSVTFDMFVDANKFQFFNGAAVVAYLEKTGILNVNTSYDVLNTKVVGAQGAAVANAVNAVGAPTNAEFNALVAVVNLLLARLRAATGHGLIA